MSDEETIRSGLEWQPEVVRAPKLEALDRLVAERDALRLALERMTHEYCGTNRVSQNVRWARQALGWEYDKGCAESVEAVRKSHAETDIP